MASLGLNLDDYVSITSYTHHPFYTAFPVEVQDNWRWDRSYNVPMDEMMQIIDNALANGYTVAWGGDVSEDGFTRKGLGIAYDTKKAQSLTGSDAARWLKLSATDKKSKLDSLGITAPEIVKVLVTGNFCLCAQMKSPYRLRTNLTIQYKEFAPSTVKRIGRNSTDRFMPLTHMTTM